MKKLMVLSGIILITLTSCGGTEKPVGVGAGTNEMKRSPCAGEGHTLYQGGLLHNASLSDRTVKKKPCPVLKTYKLRFQAI